MTSCKVHTFLGITTSIAISSAILRGIAPLFYCWQATPRNRDHTLPVLPPETLQEEGCYVTLDRLEKLVRPFAMPAEDFPPATTPQGFSGLFMKGGGVLERLVNFWPFNKANSKPWCICHSLCCGCAQNWISLFFLETQNLNLHTLSLDAKSP